MDSELLLALRMLLKELEDGEHDHATEECYREGYIDAIVYILDMASDFE